MDNIFRVYIVSLLALSLEPASVNASEFDYVIELGVSNSDNVTRVEEDPIDENYMLASLGLDYQHDSRKIETNIKTDLEYRSYKDDTFDNETVGELDADVLLKLIPEILSWQVRDVFGNLQSNPFEPDTPGNRENVNRFETGPNLRIRFGAVTALELGGRYSITRFEESNIDNDTMSGRVSLIRRLSPHRTLSLNVTTDNVEYEDSVANTDFDRRSVYLGFNSEISRGSLLVNLGYNELREDNEVVDGHLVNIEFNRSFSPTFSFTLGYHQGLSDASDQIGGIQRSGQEFSNSYQAAGVSDPFDYTSFSILLESTRDRNNFFLSGSYDEYEYLTDSLLDSDRSELSFGYGRSLGSAWQFRLGGSLEETNFKETRRSDDDTTWRVGLSRKFGRALGVSLDFYRMDRDSDVAEQSYEENLVRLAFSYSRR